MEAPAEWVMSPFSSPVPAVRRIFDAIRRAHERKAAREVERHLGLSGQKLTDEMERKMMERLTRNQNFRP